MAGGGGAPKANEPQPHPPKDHLLPATIDLEPAEKNGVLDDALRAGRAVYIPTDLRHKDQVLKACEGAEVVFHMAAPNSSINNYQLHHSINVDGTKNVIDACVQGKVKRLIYTRSPSVVFDGVHGILDGEESLPYPAKAYFITNMEPIKFWEFVSLILEGLGYERCTILVISHGDPLQILQTIINTAKKDSGSSCNDLETIIQAVETFPILLK